MTDDEMTEILKEIDGPVLKDPKFDVGKIEAWEVMGRFSQALELVCKHGTRGIEKYERGSWLRVEDAERRYKDALMRHWLKLAQGEVEDEEGFDHLTAIAWNSLALLEMREREQNGV